MTFNVIVKRTGKLWDPRPERRTGPPTRREKERPGRGRRAEDLVSFAEMVAGWDEAFPDTASQDAPGSTIPWWAVSAPG